MKPASPVFPWHVLALPREKHFPWQASQRHLPSPKSSPVQQMETWQTLLFCTSMHPVRLVTSALTKTLFPAPFERVSTIHAKQAQTTDFRSPDFFFCLQNQISLPLHYDSSMNVSPFIK